VEVRLVEALALLRLSHAGPVLPAQAWRNVQTFEPGAELVDAEELARALAYLEAHGLALAHREGWRAGPVLEAWQRDGGLAERWGYPALGLPVERLAGVPARVRLSPCGKPQRQAGGFWVPLFVAYGWTWRRRLPGVAGSSSGRLLLPVTTDTGPAWAVYDRVGTFQGFGWTPAQAVT